MSADRWHKSRPAAGETSCREHGKAPTAEHGKGDRWAARWRDEDGTQRSRNFPRKPAADSFEAEMLTRRDAGTSLDMARGKALVRDYAAAWREGLTCRPSTAERLERVFRLHLDPLPLGALPMARVRPSHLRAWAKDRAQVLAPSTLAVVWANVAGMFSAAVLDRVIGVSPCAGVKLPPSPAPARFIPTAGQVRAVAEALPERYRAVAWLAAGCGWRRNEILGAEASAVDFLRRTAEVRQQILTVKGESPYLGPPKTRTSARVSEMPGVVSLALARHMEKFPPSPREIQDRTEPHKPQARKAALIFTTVPGGPVHPATWAAIWRKAADVAGIPRGSGVHCLRHYYATVLIHNGASVKDVQLAMGHATPTITLNVYAGEWPGSGARARAIVDAALGAVPSVCPASGGRAR